MYTSMVWMILVGAAIPGERAASPTWLTDYGQAQRQGKKLERPLAVFLAPGKNGWQKLVRDGKLPEEALRDLADGYVCVHIDTDTATGKKWAGEFEMRSGLGLVLSDRSGDFQSYRNEGNLAATELARSLERHSGKTVTRISPYPPETSRGSSTIIESPSTQGRTIIYDSPRFSGRACSS
jgi:hypothetical protein